MGKLTVEVAHWHAVATWTWDAGDDVCGAKLCIIPYYHKKTFHIHTITSIISC